MVILEQNEHFIPTLLKLAMVGAGLLFCFAHGFLFEIPESCLFDPTVKIPKHRRSRQQRRHRRVASQLVAGGL
jgi:hypothetical protein